MKLQDALFNWLQIRIVADARPEDEAARETVDFFADILRDDHRLQNVSIAAVDETMYHVQYEADGKTKRQLFGREAAEQLLADIEAHPKYNNR